MQNTKITMKHAIILVISFSYLTACHIPLYSVKEVDNTMPNAYKQNMIADSLNVSDVAWKEFFDDPYLTQLIDSALLKNQEMNIIFQELIISENEVYEKSGEYLPFVNGVFGAGGAKPGRFTRDGAVEHSLHIKEDKEFPEPLGEFQIGGVATWEVDIWHKLRNAKDAAQLRYLAENEGRRYFTSQLVAEIANSYYELIAMDNLLSIINENAVIQKEALRKVEIQKDNAKANQLAVNRFNAQLLNTTNLQYKVKQEIVELENRINFLTARYPAPIERTTSNYLDLEVSNVLVGLPNQLLRNRPDIRQSEYQIKASELDVKVARANFYPSLDLRAGIGLQAFNPVFLVNPEFIAFDLVGDMIAPLVNRRAIEARYNMATASQIQALYNYNQTLLNAYVDVVNQMAKLDNYSVSFDMKKQEVDILIESVEIANNLFRYAKADYVEVLLTQEEVLDAKMELVEIKLQQLLSRVDLYRALGGGWQ